MRGFWFLLCLCFGLFVSTANAVSGAPPYVAGKHGKNNQGELRYIDGVPVLLLKGSPEEMGEQTGVLAVAQAKRLYNFPGFARQIGN